MDLTPVFDQYLRTTSVPQLSIKINSKGFNYKWDKVNSNFNMPVDIKLNGKIVRLFPTVDEKSYKVRNLSSESLEVLTDHFYITTR